MNDERIQKDFSGAIIAGASVLATVAIYPKIKAGFKEMKKDVKKIIQK